MRFLFVDRITAIEPQRIVGFRYFGSEDPWRHSDSQGHVTIATSVISEAIGQLVSWKSLRDRDFCGRPVFLLASNIALGQPVPTDSKVELEAWITSENHESFMFSGVARVGDTEIARITDCGGYYMPLHELEDPAVTRERYNILISTGTSDCHAPSAAFPFAGLCGHVARHIPRAEIEAERVFHVDEAYYRDHFPRFPVTPIVMINEMIGQVAGTLLRDFGASDAIPISVQDLKIKAFIRPGDTVTTHVRLLERFENEVETLAEIRVGGRRILRGRYRYILKGVSQ